MNDSECEDSPESILSVVNRISDHLSEAPDEVKTAQATLIDWVLEHYQEDYA